MTATARVTLGMTEADRENGYLPTMDGWRPGAPQMLVHLEVPVDLLRGASPQDIAEACFQASNIPQEVADRTDLTGWIARALLPRRELAQIGDLRSMCVGDTVGMGDTRLACAAFGWESA